MIVVNATVWPGGSEAQAYELLCATISNRSTIRDRLESYHAHVLSRPNKHFGVIGYEADVEIREHRRADGFAPLLCSILGQAAGQCPSASNQNIAGVVLPSARTLTKVTIEDAAAFERRLRERK